jgi:hypothetical protein
MKKQWTWLFLAVLSGCATHAPVSGKNDTPVTSSFHTAGNVFRDSYAMRAARHGKQLTTPNFLIFADLKGDPLPHTLSAYTEDDQAHNVMEISASPTCPDASPCIKHEVVVMSLPLRYLMSHQNGFSVGFQNKSQNHYFYIDAAAVAEFTNELAPYIEKENVPSKRF